MIHPLFVHLPIGLLVIYSIFEMTRFKVVNQQPYWFYTKAILSISGVLMAYLALATGEGAEHLIEETGTDFQKSIIETHATLAGATTAIFSILAFSYLIEWLKRSPKANEMMQRRLGNIFSFLVRLSDLIKKPSLMIILAALGLALLTITGGLGAAMVYGKDVDPIVSFIYSMFSPLFES